MTGSCSQPESTSAITPLHVENEDASSVQVAIRVRPMLSSEAGSTQCIEVLSNDSRRNCVVRIGGEIGFTFDEAFPGTATQQAVFETRVVPLVQSCLEGYNATVLAYGQTGSGKTHTIMGPHTSTVMQDEAIAGVIPRALRSIFDALQRNRNSMSNGKENGQGDYEFEVRVQFLELYGESIRDLLSPQQTSERLTIRDVGIDEPEVVGATQHKVENAEEALLCLTRGMLRRVTGATAMNASSSRSHAILSVLVEQTSVLEGVGGPSDPAQQQPQHVEVKRSKFNFVDLAGSERQKRTQATGQRLKEGIDINKGLLVLGNVISALGDPKKSGKTFVPYRDSKLTRLLKGSLGGNHKTLMIACVSPSSNNLEESLNCLRYANRAKNIQNNAVVNVDAGSRLVVELRGQVQALATELLRVREGEDPSKEESFSMDSLKRLAGGMDADGAYEGMRRGVSPMKVTTVTPDMGISASGKRADVELERTREELRRVQSELTTVSESLTSTKAEREFYKLQAGGSEAASDQDRDNNQAFLERATAYEREIALLKESLRVAQSGPFQAGKDTNTPPSEVIEKARKLLFEEQAHLSSLQEELSRSIENSPERRERKMEMPYSPELAGLHAKALGSIDHSNQLDAEEAATEAELSAMTQKYTGRSLIDDYVANQTKDESFPPSDDAALDGGDDDESSDRRRQQLEAHLSELSRSIDAKQELIEQLQISQQKYATMREFYEEKLQHMEEQVREKETEREQLVQELKKLEESHPQTRDPQKKDLEERLAKKDEHIATLRQKKLELLSLTRVSSRNEAEIARLRSDVTSMKHKKVELQKQITQERKRHASEIKQLKKEAMQKDKEAAKYKKISDKKAFEAEKAQRIAKSRLDEVGQLRTKYKEAEKKLRMHTLKRGVMEKAGLDSVIVGRREPVRKSRKQKNLNVDSMRDFLDSKVAEVGRKEAIADKLAIEWEEHLELVSQKEELLAGSGNRTSKESIDALNVKIKYKEGRIRHLASRLEKKQAKLSTQKGTAVQGSFLDEEVFKSLSEGSTELSAARVASRVLFGMVVRERRRVAALARTASSLDEKVLEAQERASLTDAALRSYMDEEMHQRASMTQDQQEQILSLMEMVQTEESHNMKNDTKEEAPQSLSSGRIDSRALVLANERIALLEKQLGNLNAERESKDVYKAKQEEANALLEDKCIECEELEREIDSLRSSLRQIREMVSLQGIHQVQDKEEFVSLPADGETFAERVNEIVVDALHPPNRKAPAHRSTESRSPNSALVRQRSTSLTPKLKRHVELMHSSDSEEDFEAPEWAGDIMKDLALIANGQVPPALKGQVELDDIDTGLMREQPKPQGTSVFDRLTDPESFTGVTKRLAAGKPRTSSKERGGRRKSDDRKGPQQRKALSKEISESLNKVVIPELKSSAQAKNVNNSDESAREQQGVEAAVEQAKGFFVGEIAVRRERSRSPEIERRREVNDIFVTDSDRLLDTLLDDDFYATDARQSKIDDYTQQDVFERLQRTTTHSYAGKATGPTYRPSSQETNWEKKQAQRLPEDTMPPSSKESASYVQQNVFERLQKTTTQAYAGKKNWTLPRVEFESRSAAEENVPFDKNLRPKSTGRESPVRPPVAEGDVFERLQKTTTHAYAVKQRGALEETDRRNQY